MIWLIAIAIFVVIFPRFLIWALVIWFFGHIVLGFLGALKSPGKHKKRETRGPGIDNWG